MQFLQHNELSATLGHIGNVTSEFCSILSHVGCARLLYDSYLHIRLRYNWHCIMPL